MPIPYLILTLFPLLLTPTQTKKIDTILVVMESNDLNRKYFEFLQKSMNESFDELNIKSNFYLIPEYKVKREKVDFDNLDENSEPLFQQARLDSTKALYRDHRKKIDLEINELVQSTSPSFIMLIEQTRQTNYRSNYGIKTGEIGAFEIRLFDTSRDKLVWERYQEVSGVFNLKSAVKSSTKEIFKGLKKNNLL